MAAARTVRSGALYAGKCAAAAQIRLDALWRRAAHLYWPRFCLDGNATQLGDVAPTLPSARQDSPTPPPALRACLALAGWFAGPVDAAPSATGG